ncbi:MAG: hypothetical protein K1X47_17940 [Cyclobacteriaceae bacterium]|nr:hypothetical protein [Cyclobacteriaceae bacterium]
MNYHLISYTVYLPITAALTIAVARVLFRNGRTFLVDIHHGNEILADSVNRLLLAGFYLINIGYAVFTMRIFQTIESSQTMIEVLSSKLGAITLILGAMHFFNLYVLFRLRSKAKTTQAL